MSMTIEEVRARTAQLVRDLPCIEGLPEFVDEMKPEHLARYRERFRASCCAAESLVVEFGADPELFERARTDDGADGELLGYARQVAYRGLQADEDRSRHLASLVCHGLPGDAMAFAPRHVRRALELVPGLIEEAQENFRAESPDVAPPSFVAVVEWLERFETEACAIV